jgi:ribonuclease HII
MKVLGIDEAGKGPVIGSMIIAGVMIKQGSENKIDGVKDSKLLTHKKRLELDKKIKQNTKYLIIEVEPKEIDNALLADHLNLNWLEAHKQAEIINKLKPDKAIIDCPSPNCKRYEEFLKKLLDNKKIELVVEHKADMKYPTCAAASILAKVRREEHMDQIKTKYGDTGAGYPADPKTKKFIAENWEKHPEIFRKTWSTFKNQEKMKHQKKLGDF